MQISKVNNTASFGKFKLLNPSFGLPEITSKRQQILDKITKNFRVTARAGEVSYTAPTSWGFSQDAHIISMAPFYNRGAKYPEIAIGMKPSSNFSELVKTIKKGIAFFDMLK